MARKAKNYLLQNTAACWARNPEPLPTITDNPPESPRGRMPGACRGSVKALPRERGVRVGKGNAAFTRQEGLFEVIDYVEPRMKADQAYPPVVGVSVLRGRERLTNEDAEKQLMASL